MIMNYLKSKTMWFATFIAVAGVLEESQHVVTQLVGPEKTGALMLFISAGVAVLRIVTTQPLSEK